MVMPHLDGAKSIDRPGMSSKILSSGLCKFFLAKGNFHNHGEVLDLFGQIF